MIYRRSFWAAAFGLLLALALLVVLMAPPVGAPALACDAATDCVLRSEDASLVPAPVLADAQQVAEEFYGRNLTKVDDMTSQLVGIYVAARDRDVVVIFNPGGWGWDPVAEIPGWQSILSGINQTLESYGLTTLTIDYKRTAHGLDGPIGESLALAGGYPFKFEEQAARVDFLLRHLPRLRVILTGESEGARISEEVMQALRDNPRVYSIQTGPPFWHPRPRF